MPCFGSSSSSRSKAHARPIQRKFVVLGDGACGKSSLLSCYVKGFFPTDYEPTVFENFVSETRVDGVSVLMSLWDTAGQEEFDRLRSLSYADTHIIMCCFSVDSIVSLENVETKWLPEIHEQCPGVKIILVALKCDLRESPHLRAPAVSYEEGLEVARRIKASRYLECSAKENRGVGEAFDAAARVSVTARARGGDGRDERGRRRVVSGGSPPRKSGSGCVIM